MVHLWRECGVCDGLPSIKPVVCKITSTKAGVIWQAMIWALAQAGIRTLKNQIPLRSNKIRSPNSTAHLDTALAARLHLLFALSPNCFRVARQDSELHTIS